MPWQMAPPLIVVGGAFCAIGAGIAGLDYLQFGRPKRVMQTEYGFQLDRRDEFIKKARQNIETNGDAIKNRAVFEGREDDYSQFNNTYNTYKIPSRNHFMDKVNASK
mmetsp:Transcript_15688/g.26151  ORF Transcript_15688/g.26151 Transcript_15688/m.26151 type:complete len:107 (-) Transcript_15688:260-580(-)